MAKSNLQAVETADAQTGEILPSPQSTSHRAMVTTINGKTVRLVKELSLPVLSTREGQTVMFTIKDAIKLGKKLDEKKDAAHICTVTNLENGANYTYLVPAVVQSVFADEYPENSYVGKSFAVLNNGKREGKRHIDYSVVEIAVE